MFVLMFPQSKKTAKIVLILLSVMLAAALLTALVFQCIAMYRVNTWGCITAEVVDYDTSDSKNVWTEYSYTYEGEEYINREKGHSSTMFVGDQITIFCNPSNPRQIVIGDHMYAMADTFFMMSGVVGVFFIIYLINFLTVLAREKKMNQQYS